MVTTKKSKALKLKRKLIRELSGKRKYITTYKDIKTYFKLFNSALFDSKLSPFGQVEIKDLKRPKDLPNFYIYLDSKKRQKNYNKLKSWMKAINSM